MSPVESVDHTTLYRAALSTLAVTLGLIAVYAGLGAGQDLLRAMAATGVVGLLLRVLRVASRRKAVWVGTVGLTLVFLWGVVDAHSASYVGWLGAVALNVHFLGGRPNVRGPLLVVMGATLAALAWLAVVPAPHPPRPELELVRAGSLGLTLLLLGYWYEAVRSAAVDRASAGYLKARRATETRSRLFGRITAELAEPLKSIVEHAERLDREASSPRVEKDVALLLASARAGLAQVMELVAHAGTSERLSPPQPELARLLARGLDVPVPAADHHPFGIAGSGRVVRRAAAGIVGISLVGLGYYLAIRAWADALSAGLVIALCGLVVHAVHWWPPARTGVVAGLGLQATFLLTGLLTGSPSFLAWAGTAAVAMLFVGGPRTSGVVAGTALVSMAISVAGVLVRGGPFAAALDAELLRVGTLPFSLAVIGWTYEVTHRRWLLAAERARTQACHAATTQSIFLGQVSHELRTPLNAILGAAQALGTEPLSSPERHAVDLVHRAGQGMLARVNSLLDVARGGAGAVQLSLATADLEHVLEDVIHGLEREASARGVVVERRPLPPSGRTVRADEPRLRQALGAVLGRAIRNCAGATLEVKTRVEDRGGRRRLSVTVSGPAARVDEPAGSDDELATRIGVDILRAMGGVVELGGAAGQGTLTVELELDAAAPPVAPPPASRPVQVLVVDDTAVNLTVARRLLERLGAGVHTVASGEAALELLGSVQVDLILMDLQMPGLDGFETTRRLIARGERARVVALTASAQPETPAACHAAGMSGCMVKPVRLQQLADLVGELGTPVSRSA